ncbi:hypothetical protein D9M68_902230 [compost metagenome]
MSSVRTISSPADEDFFWQLTQRETRHVAKLIEGPAFKSWPVAFQALVANFAVSFHDPEKKQPLPISLDWLEFIERFTGDAPYDPIGKLTDVIGQKVKFIHANREAA